MNLKVISHHDEAWKSVDEAIGALSNREPRAHILFGHEITLTGDGKLKLGTEEEFQMASSGLRAMLKRLKIPFNFGTEILPTEDLVRDVNSLLTLSGKRFIVMVRPDDGTVVGFTSEEFTPIRYVDLLRVVSPPVESEIESIRVNDENLVVNIVKNRDIEPVKGDISKIGNRVVSSNTGFGDLTINTLIFRLVCSNGATVAREFGGSTFSLRGRSSQDILSDGMMFVNQASADVAHISAGLDRMVQLPISQMSLYNVDAKRVMRQPAMEILPGKIRSIIGDKEQAENLFKETTPDTPTYDVYNNITQAAQRYNLSRRTKLEVIGGSMLSVAMKDVRQAA